MADIDNYNTPTPINRTSIPGNYITLSLLYWVPATGNGTFIVDANGYLRDVNTWVEGSNATGVALITDEHKIVIAPNNVGEYSWCPYNKLLNCVTYTELSDALTDYDGVSNTLTIANNGGNGAIACRTYESGIMTKLYWWMPSAGELNTIFQNVESINIALEAISGTPLTSDEIIDYWSSTQYDNGVAWAYFCKSYEWIMVGKTTQCNVRPVGNYDQVTPRPL